ncbi:NAD(P)-dependent dehydrogenase, short-chain alcohol dehydrogenase family [Streptomyces sp. LamerLS-316]|uniref:SDR family NAD(P)-dependent oxidoreductase n=1 Tax=unclassified Streptomyces TaxID=2593676 RepID=UPI000823F92E|nr:MULTISPECIES: SDR family NAD(P)-dependent oxidoreductase [unclassified Streptomyces]MYQ37761.1 SDR family NAD(P)-dependent oxidoreductase [Streptomyces sp. SID4921]SCK46483.1 NAD(P)-dependent dehydrogenase, short-chain alcohol dehydrogenase family [Streptomyces sp. LamerLS-316]
MYDHDRLTTPFHSHATATEVLDGADLAGRRAVVTGGASGIGTETVRALTAAGAEVTVATRDPASAEATVRALDALPGPGSVRSAPLDLADLASVESFARTWQGPLDILVANAGIMAVPERRVGDQGWELHLATNHLGHFALATALHPNLRAAGSARVVAVSSGAHRAAAFDFEDPHFERRPYDRWTAYAQSKTADVLLAVGARRWASDGITANALNPGWISTNLQRHLDDETLRAMGAIDEKGDIIPQPYYKEPEQGAATSVLLAASPLLEGVTGRYFEDNQEARLAEDSDQRPGGVAAHALDPGAADRLWEYAARAVAAARR